MTDKLKKLLERCKCGVYLTVNEHRDGYESAQSALEQMAQQECPPHISDEVRAEILRTDNIVDLQFYPDTPIGSYRIIHHDVDAALSAALECVADKARKS